MNIQQLLAGGRVPADRPTRAALIGVGQFGRALLSQSRRVPGLELAALCDLDPAKLIGLCDDLGIADRRVVDNRAAGQRAFERGQLVLTDDPTIAIGLDLDVVVEATGDGEAGARNCLAAIDQGRHLVLVTKETDCMVGPLLSAKARAAGLVLSQVDGDQPSLLLGLVSWARGLGLTIACAGKASEYDFVFHPERGEVRAEGLDRTVDVMPEIWSMDPVARSAALAAIPQRTPPDYCEMCLVANGSGLRPDHPTLHAPVARTVELPEIFRPQADGGILAATGCLDIFNCFRRADEISFAGGVFAVVETPDAESGRLFAEKGMPVSADGRHLLIYNPTHLLGAEAPLSILSAHRLGQASGTDVVEPVCDVVMRADRDLPAGTVLSGRTSHHRIDGISAELHDYRLLSADAPAPYFLGLDRRTRQDVRQGELVPLAAIEEPEGATLWRLRREQDEFWEA